MGHVRVKIALAHPERPETTAEVPDALVDTGATLTTIPRKIADTLGLSVYGKRTVRPAAGLLAIDESYARFVYDGRSTVTPVLVSDTYPGVLVGVLTLEALALAVDPGTGKLVNSELLLL